MVKSQKGYASNCKKQKLTGLADSFLIIKRRSARKALLFYDICPSPAPHTLPAPHLSRLTAPLPVALPHKDLTAPHSLPSTSRALRPTATLQPLLIRPVASGAASRRNFSP